MAGPSDLSESVQRQRIKQENLHRNSFLPYRYFAIFNHRTPLRTPPLAASKEALKYYMMTTISSAKFH